MPEKGKLRLLTHFLVREDAQRLYGFSSEEERKIVESIRKHNIEFLWDDITKTALPEDSFDIICCDEAHRTTGIENRSYWTFVHDNKNIDSKKRLYMTATPRIYQAKIKAKVGDSLYDMSDVKQYGPEFHKLSFHDAVTKYHALS